MIYERKTANAWTLSVGGLLLLTAFCLAEETATTPEKKSSAPANATRKSHKKVINKYVRILRENGPKEDDGEYKSLQTSVCRYHTADGTQQVDLIGAIHIGERSYYEELNRRFREYDALLYELVAPEGTRVPKGGGEPSSAVGYMQSGMTQMLGLTYQLSEVDYTPANLVHADMSPEEFSASMEKRKESFAKMMFRAMGQSLVQQTRPEKRGQEARVLAAMIADDRERALRCILSDQFADIDGATLVFGGPDGSTLITERNKKALRVMKTQLATGKKKIGIFYGAGHLQDMAERLEKEFGMREGKREWLTAWNLQPTKNEK